MHYLPLPEEVIADLVLLSFSDERDIASFLCTSRPNARLSSHAAFRRHRTACTIQRAWHEYRAICRVRRCPLAVPPDVDFQILFDFALFDTCPILRQRFYARCNIPRRPTRRYARRFNEIMMARFDLRVPGQRDIPPLA